MEKNMKMSRICGEIVVCLAPYQKLTWSIHVEMI